MELHNIEGDNFGVTVGVTVGDIDAGRVGGAKDGGIGRMSGKLSFPSNFAICSIAPFVELHCSVGIARVLLLNG